MFYVLLTPPLFNPNFGGVPVAPDRRCWASASTRTLSYLAVKLFSKNSNLCDHGTWSLRTDGQTDGRLTVASLRSALASRGKKCLMYIYQTYRKIKTGVLIFGPLCTVFKNLFRGLHSLRLHRGCALNQTDMASAVGSINCPSRR